MANEAHTLLFKQCEEIQAKYETLRATYERLGIKHEQLSTKYQELRTLCEEFIRLHGTSYSSSAQTFTQQYNAFLKENQP